MSFNKQLFENILRNVKGVKSICLFAQNYINIEKGNQLNLDMYFFDKNGKFLNTTYIDEVCDDISDGMCDYNKELNKIKYGINYCSSSKIKKILGDDFFQFFNSNGINVEHYDYEEIIVRAFEKKDIADIISTKWADKISRIKLKKNQTFWIQPNSST